MGLVHCLGDVMSVLRFRQSVAVALALAVVMLTPGVAGASTPPSPPPYPHVELELSGAPNMTCVDPTGNVVYDDTAWSLEPLIRGPLFAPTVVFLSGVGGENRPVVPLRFTSTAYPILWSTVDGGPPLDGLVESVSGRPVGYGPVATSTAPMIKCSYSLVGHMDFGTFRITAGLQQALGLPHATIGRTLTFDGEGDVSFETRPDQFPLTAANYKPNIQPWLVPDTPPYPWVDLPTIMCRNGSKVVYRGGATTLAPAVRGLDWAPITFWLKGDRIVTPSWSRTKIDATWATVEGEPARSGTIAKDQSFAPMGLGKNPYPTSKMIDCTWRVRHDEVIEVTPYLAVQLGLPNRVIQRDIKLVGTGVVHAYVPDWLFPPS